MENKLKEGYNLFIKRDENNNLVGVLSLKENDENYTDIIQLEIEQLESLRDYATVYNQISEDFALFISYHPTENEYFVSIQKKENGGEYNDQIIWNNIVVSTKTDLSVALHRLEEKIHTKLEGVV